MKYNLFLFALFSTHLLFGQCFTDWSTKVSVTINNSQNLDTLIDFTVLVELDTETLIKEGKMASDGSGIRFSDLSCEILPHYLESGINTDKTKLWVKIPSIPAKESINIWMAYGNSSALDSSSGTDTFPFFDDFITPPINFSSCGDPTVEMNQQKLDISWSSAGVVSIISNKSFPVSEIYTAEMKVDSTNSSYPAIAWYSQKEGTGYSLYANNDYAGIGKSNTSSSSEFCYPIDFASSTSPATSSDGIWGLTWIQDEAIVGTFPTVQYPINSIDGTYKRTDDLVLCAGTVGNGPGILILDWIRARKYTNPVPVVTISD